MRKIDADGIKKAFASHVPSVRPLCDAHPSAVMLALSETKRGYDLILERRSDRLRFQPGAICLPGGGICIRDGAALETPREAAVRETKEELLLAEGQLSVLAALDAIMGPDGSPVWVFAGELLDYRDTYCLDEVAGILRVPLAFFLREKPEKYPAELWTVPGDDFPYERIPGGREYPWVKKRMEISFYQYEDVTIWGMTARAIELFCRGLAMGCLSFPSQDTVSKEA